MVNTQPEPLRKIVEPSTRLMWPELQDDHLENSRKVPLDRHDIIIDKVIKLSFLQQFHSQILIFIINMKVRAILSSSLYLWVNTLITNSHNNQDLKTFHFSLTPFYFYFRWHVLMTTNMLWLWQAITWFVFGDELMKMGRAKKLKFF